MTASHTATREALEHVPRQQRSVARRIWICLATFVLTAVAAPGSIAAEEQATDVPASAPLRALVWLQPDTDDVLSRIRGQTNDLRVELLVDALDSMPGDLGAQLRTATMLSRQQDASLVIWFVKQTDTETRLIVHIALPKTRRLLTRDVGPCTAASDSVGLSSAVKESAALIVRAAIQAVLGGETIGEVNAARFDAVTEPQTSEQPAPTAAPVPPDPSETQELGRDTTPPKKQAQMRSDEAEVAESQQPSASFRIRDWPWALGVEWLSLYDGVKGHPFAQCALVRAELRLLWLKAFVDASGCPNREIDGDKYGRFRIARQQAALGINLLLLQTWLEASVGAQAGTVFYERTTTQAAPGASASSPKLYVIGAIGPELRLLVPARGSRFQAGFVLGLDFVTSSLRIGYADPAAPAPDHFAQVAKLSLVQPYATLGLVLRL